MPYNGKKVVQIARERGIKAKEFKAAVFPNRTGSFSWDELKRVTNPNAETIEATADFLQCSIDALFDRKSNPPTNQVNGDNNTVGSYNVTADPETIAATNRHLHEVIDRQDKTIDDLNHRIDQLIEIIKKIGNRGKNEPNEQ